MMLDGLANVTLKMAKEEFKMFCGMRPKYGRWVIPQRKIEKEIIEANIIFAVKPQNVQSVPKIISLLGKSHIIVALPPKKTENNACNVENGLINMKILQNGQGAFNVVAIDILWKSIFVLKMSVPKAPVHVHIS